MTSPSSSLQNPLRAEKKGETVPVALVATATPASIIIARPADRREWKLEARQDKIAQLCDSPEAGFLLCSFVEISCN